MGDRSAPYSSSYITEKLNTFFVHCSKIRDLTLTRSRVGNDPVIIPQAIKDGVKGLTRLSINQCDDISLLVEMLKGCNTLTGLCITDYERIADLSGVLPFIGRNLSILSIRKTNDAIMKNCPKLVELKIYDPTLGDGSVEIVKSKLIGGLKMLACLEIKMSCKR
jgi:hypothetical protein